MPHLTVEYTQNLKTKVNMPLILEKLHSSLKVAPGIEMNRVKSRLIHTDRVIVDSDAVEIHMIHVTAYILTGRDVQTRKLYGEILFEELMKQASFIPDISLTVEVREMERASYFRN